jgi:tRNA-modifying protein YgfZ
MNPSDAELASTLAGACQIHSQGLITVRGADGATFLHGQLSNDFAQLDLRHARLAAFCTPKGRMLASLVGFRRGADELWLSLRTDLLAPTLKRLSMFVLRAKAKLEDAGETLVTVGLAGPALAAVDAQSLPLWGKQDLGAASVVRLPDGAGQPRALWVGPPDAAAPLMASLPALAAADWDWLEVASGVAPVMAATADAFVPQMLNYELVGGVNFQKGCYPGQEIVARSQYRGTIKRRAQRLDGGVEMQAGDEIFVSTDSLQPSGLVALAAARPDGQGFSAIAELKLAALEGGTLHLRSADGPLLTLRALPYPLPSNEGAAA